MVKENQNTEHCASYTNYLEEILAMLISPTVIFAVYILRVTNNAHKMQINFQHLCWLIRGW